MHGSFREMLGINLRQNHNDLMESEAFFAKHFNDIEPDVVVDYGTNAEVCVEEDVILKRKCPSPVENKEESDSDCEFEDKEESDSDCEFFIASSYNPESILLGSPLKKKRSRSDFDPDSTCTKRVCPTVNVVNTTRKIEKPDNVQIYHGGLDIATPSMPTYTVIDRPSVGYGCETTSSVGFDSPPPSTPVLVPGAPVKNWGVRKNEYHVSYFSWNHVMTEIMKYYNQLNRVCVCKHLQCDVESIKDVVESFGVERVLLHDGDREFHYKMGIGCLPIKNYFRIVFSYPS